MPKLQHPELVATRFTKTQRREIDLVATREQKSVARLLREIVVPAIAERLTRASGERQRDAA